ncbi:carbohydrate-binding protein [Agarivorans sp. 1_MG-2023]|uniref:carbohydrate-binding protein n=1 Tax=Agarivorans sp. 1_MG-2023 TaxID=3062634 RepID=UPI0026E1F1A7|nr:carbohydrate-binding protein [Agarivorans sp. 1_MG-2023]MDO6764688.1 carbohydrate-binding protein [Agarivorans sp. 1_MG-2023]
MTFRKTLLALISIGVLSPVCSAEGLQQFELNDGSSLAADLGVSAKIEAEDYTAMSGIKTEPSSEGGLNVGWVEVGDWLEYNVNVVKAGTYNVQYRVANKKAGGKFDVALNGTKVHSVTVPQTGGWQKYVTVTKSIYLSAGNHTLKLSATGAAWNLNYSEFKLVNAAEDIGEINPIPGKVEAEEYSQMSGVKTESSSEGGLNVGWIDAGDWLEYNVKVAQTGTYDVGYRVASIANSGKFDVSVNGVNMHSVSVPQTGDWQRYVTVNKPMLLSAGSNKIRLTATGSAWNINHSEFTLNNADSTPESSLPWSDPGFSISQETKNWSSGVIDISGVASADISMSIEGSDAAKMEASDYLNVFYKVDGGEQIPLSKNTDGFTKKQITAKGIIGSSIEIIVVGATSYQDETYYVSEVEVTNGDEDTGPGNPDQGNPDEGNPDQGNPDQGNPDEGNPDEGNPDQGNPDEGNPDEGNPDQGAPDLEAPEVNQPNMVFDGSMPIFFDFSDASDLALLSVKTGSSSLVNKNVAQGKFTLQPEWSNSENTITLSALSNQEDLRSASLSVDIQLATSYINNGQMTVTMALTDNQNRTRRVNKTLSASLFTADKLNRFEVDAQRDILNDEEFDLSQVSSVQIHLNANGKPPSINGDIVFDNFVVNTSDTSHACEKGVNIDPGVSIQSVINANPAGTTYCLAAGRFTQQSIKPKTGDTLIGAGAHSGGTVLDGEHITEKAITIGRGNEVSNVTVKNLRVKNYRPGAYNGAINLSTHGWLEIFGSPTNTHLTNVHVHHNFGDGIYAGSGTYLNDVKSTDNAALGLGGSGKTIHMIGGELSRNNTNLSAVNESYKLNWHSGGAKIVTADDVIIRGVNVVDNLGLGLWCDITCTNALIEDNYVANNVGIGIFYEISYDAVIRNNTVIGNGFGDTRGWIWGGGISVGTARDIVIEGNCLQGNNRGIALIDQSNERDPERIHSVNAAYRDSRAYKTVDVIVRNNQLISNGLSGSAQSNGEDGAVFTTTWTNNTYSADSRFQWQNLSNGSLNAWQNKGNDLGSAEITKSSCQ